jgi:UDP-glucose:glycoprotein glucosyltransferase
MDPPFYSAIFYASLVSPNFRDLHSYLLSLSTGPNPRVEYIMRHIPPNDRDPAARNILSGYGVSLDLKKMDYLALDDRHSHGGKQFGGRIVLVVNMLTYLCL